MHSEQTEAYLRRIGVERPSSPSARALRELHKARLRSVPFENLSIHLGEEILLSEEALVAKVVDARRGGFCYELNGAFAALLAALGFDVTLLQARVHGEAGRSASPTTTWRCACARRTAGTGSPTSASEPTASCRSASTSGPAGHGRRPGRGRPRARREPRRAAAAAAASIPALKSTPVTRSRHSGSSVDTPPRPAAHVEAGVEGPERAQRFGRRLKDPVGRTERRTVELRGEQVVAPLGGGERLNGQLAQRGTLGGEHRHQPSQGGRRSAGASARSWCPAGRPRGCRRWARSRCG
ncbi:hypothetical protein SALBM135S_05670 [Streptomyces alboniger]